MMTTCPSSDEPVPDRLVRVTLPDAVFGALARDGVIVRAAPRGRAWMVGRTLKEARKIVTAFGGKLEVLE